MAEVDGRLADHSLIRIYILILHNTVARIYCRDKTTEKIQLRRCIWSRAGQKTGTSLSVVKVFDFNGNRYNTLYRFKKKMYN